MAQGSSVTPIRYDLAQPAIVTTVIDATHFTATGLSMFGSGTFVGHSVWVLTKADDTATAPKGEAPKLISSFIGNDAQFPLIPGTITHLAFAAPLVAGDSVLLLHPSVANATALSLAALAATIAQVARLAGVAPVSSFVVANWQAAEQTLVNIGAAATRNKVHSLMINIAATGGAITIRMKHIVNGVLTTVYNQTFTAAVDGPGRWTINGTVGIFDVLQVTCQSNLAGDNGVAISYSYMMEAM